jgi:hypothetical protein
MCVLQCIQAAAALAAGDFMSGAVGTGDKDGPKPLPDVLVRVVSWVLGEYAHLRYTKQHFLPSTSTLLFLIPLTHHHSKEGRREVAVRLLTLLQSPTVTDLGTRGWILTALGMCFLGCSLIGSVFLNIQGCRQTGRSRTVAVVT